MIITKITKHSDHSDMKGYRTDPENPRKSPDWEYMHQCALIDQNPPANWSKFPDSSSLVKALYTDLLTNPNDVKNVYNLSVGLLRHWRHLTEKDSK